MRTGRLVELGAETATAVVRPDENPDRSDVVRARRPLEPGFGPADHVLAGHGDPRACGRTFGLAGERVTDALGAV
jgi:hypothetical protein